MVYPLFTRLINPASAGLQAWYTASVAPAETLICEQGLEQAPVRKTIARCAALLARNGVSLYVLVLLLLIPLQVHAQNVSDQTTLNGIKSFRDWFNIVAEVAGGIFFLAGAIMKGCGLRSMGPFVGGILCFAVDGLLMLAKAFGHGQKVAGDSGLGN